jgi:hypothetical protein
MMAAPCLFRITFASSVQGDQNFQALITPVLAGKPLRGYHQG